MFGWERFATGYSDFEVHRAQQKHYDAFTSVMVETGPGTWSVPAGGYSKFAETFPGGSSSSSSSDDKPIVRNAGPVTVGPAAGVEVSSGALAPRRSGGKLTFRESELIDLDEAEGSFDNMDLTQVMHPETTSGRFFGQMMHSSPWFSDIETWAEARLGDIGGAILSPFVLAGDIIYSTHLAADHASAQVDAQRAATWRENHEVLSQQWQDFNTQFPMVPEAFR